jgi:hypothetical protein
MLAAQAEIILREKRLYSDKKILARQIKDIQADLKKLAYENAILFSKSPVKFICTEDTIRVISAGAHCLRRDFTPRRRMVSVKGLDVFGCEVEGRTLLFIDSCYNYLLDDVENKIIFTKLLDVDIYDATETSMITVFLAFCQIFNRYKKLDVTWKNTEITHLLCNFSQFPDSTMLDVNLDDTKQFNKDTIDFLKDFLFSGDSLPSILTSFNKGTNHVSYVGAKMSLCQNHANPYNVIKTNVINLKAKKKEGESMYSSNQIMLGESLENCQLDPLFQKDCHKYFFFKFWKYLSGLFPYIGWLTKQELTFKTTSAPTINKELDNCLSHYKITTPRTSKTGCKQTFLVIALVSGKHKPLPEKTFDIML